MKIVVELNLDAWTTISKALIIVGSIAKKTAAEYSEANHPDAKLWAKLSEEYQDAYKRVQNAHTAACETLLDEMKEAVDHEKH